MIGDYPTSSLNWRRHFFSEQDVRFASENSVQWKAIVRNIVDVTEEMESVDLANFSFQL